MNNNLTSKEIIKRIISHDNPPRFGMDFSRDLPSDIAYVKIREYFPDPPNPYAHWGKYEELLKLTGFSGEVHTDRYNNIYGRLNGLTKGECIYPSLQTWDDFEKYKMPLINHDYTEKLKSMNYGDNPKFIIGGCTSLFSSLRDARLMPNALADTLLEPEMVTKFLDQIVEHEIEAISMIKDCGVDAIMIGDDWGTQTSTFISPNLFRELFKPAYKKIGDIVHECNMSLLMHSCGYIYGFIDDLIDAGVDVFQFDQPDAYPTENLISEFGDKSVFWSPVDIQKVLPTGDREFIENRTLEMCRLFRQCGGSWIAKDYPSYQDIGVDEIWAKWARDIIAENCDI